MEPKEAEQKSKHYLASKSKKTMFQHFSLKKFYNY